MEVILFAIDVFCQIQAKANIHHLNCKQKILMSALMPTDVG